MAVVALGLDVGEAKQVKTLHIGGAWRELPLSKSSFEEASGGVLSGFAVGQEGGEQPHDPKRDVIAQL